MATATLSGHRIVVVGGGGGGLPLAAKLGDRYGRGGFAQITLDAVVSPDGEEILPRRTLPYDTLLLCVGSVSNDFGVPGAAQRPICLDTLEEAERFHRRLLAVCVRADGRAAAGAAAHVHIVGRLIGRSLLIQGLIARLMYTSLYKMHQVSIHGLVRVIFDTLGRLLRERLEPRVKLH